MTNLLSTLIFSVRLLFFFILTRTFTPWPLLLPYRSCPLPWMFRTFSSLLDAFIWSTWSNGFAFFFFFHCSLTSSSTEIVDKSLDSSIVHTTFSKSPVNNLNIFSTTQVAGSVSPFLLSWFTMVSSRVMYLDTPSVSFSLLHLHALQLAPECLKSSMLHSVIPFIRFLQNVPCFFWRFCTFNFFKVCLIKNLVQYVQGCLALCVRYFQHIISRHR